MVVDCTHIKLVEYVCNFYIRKNRVKLAMEILILLLVVLLLSCSPSQEQIDNEVKDHLNWIDSVMNSQDTVCVILKGCK